MFVGKRCYFKKGLHIIRDGVKERSEIPKVY